MLVALALGCVAVCAGLLRWIVLLRRDLARSRQSTADSASAVAGLQAQAAVLLAERDRAVRAEAYATERVTAIEALLRERAEADYLDQLAAEQARQAEAATTAQVRADAVPFDAFVEEIAAGVWRDLGLGPHLFSRQADLVKTGKLHEFLQRVSERLQDRNPVRTVDDAIRLLTRAA